MKLDVQIAKNEVVSSEYEFSYSFLLFFMKAHFWLTDKRLIVNAPNVFLFIPTGKDTLTYPLRQIASVKTKTEFKFMTLLSGIFFLVIGFATVRYGIGLLFLLMGLGGLLGAFRNVIAITTAGSSVFYAYLPWQASDAKKMINHLNQLVAEI